MNNFGIREDYIPLVKAETLVSDPMDYWNKERISTSGTWQYYVYEKAAEYTRETGGNVVDVGCGYPKKLKSLIYPITNKVTVVEQPSMESLVRRDFPEFDFFPLNLEEKNLMLEEKFQCVICADVIEHLLNPDSLLAFLKKLLAPEGHLFLSTPDRDIERGPNCLSSPKPEHVREWNRSEFKKYLQHSGFIVLKHVHLPKKKLNIIDRLTAKIFGYPQNRKFAGCQLSVCRIEA